MTKTSISICCPWVTEMQKSVVPREVLAGQPSLTTPSLSSSMSLAHWAPLSGAPLAGQPSLARPSPSSSMALSHWVPLSGGPTTFPVGSTSKPTTVEGEL